MTGVMTQGMKDRLARSAKRRGSRALREGFEEGRLKACREANAWARRQGVNPPFPDVEDDPAAP